MSCRAPSRQSLSQVNDTDVTTIEPGNEVLARVTSGHGTRGARLITEAVTQLLLGREPGQVPRRRRRAGAPAAGAQGPHLARSRRACPCANWPISGAASASFVTIVTDGLEAAGYAERRVAPHDRRIKTVELDPGGIDARELGLRWPTACGPADAPDAERAGHARPPAHQGMATPRPSTTRRCSTSSTSASPAGWPPSAPASTGASADAAATGPPAAAGRSTSRPTARRSPAWGRARPHARRVGRPGPRPGRRDQVRSEGGQGRCQGAGQGGQGRCQGPGVGGRRACATTWSTSSSPGVPAGNLAPMGIHDEDVARYGPRPTSWPSSPSNTRRCGGSGGRTGLCPFHTEKTAPFSVNPNENVFYCFGCQAQGDVFDFVMQKEQVDFPTAVERLAGKAGVTLRYTDRNEGESRKRRPSSSTPCNCRGLVPRAAFFGLRRRRRPQLPARACSTATWCATSRSAGRLTPGTLHPGAAARQGPGRGHRPRLREQPGPAERPLPGPHPVPDLRRPG